jgi:uncharacterized SAM-binding protein YcdF (DUF218 family)
MIVLLCVAWRAKQRRLGVGLLVLEEIQSIKRLIVERRWRRVGLVTSAWHMARAMPLARDAQLDLQPLPADFRTPQTWSPIWIIPGEGSFQDTGLACKEMLARVVGR